MQIVIDIPKEEYKRVMDGKWEGNDLASYIEEGTPLPKGHGRIGDLDKILIWLIYKKGIIDDLKCGEIAPVFKDATIIKAESEVKNDFK